MWAVKLYFSHRNNSTPVIILVHMSHKPHGIFLENWKIYRLRWDLNSETLRDYIGAWSHRTTVSCRTFLNYAFLQDNVGGGQFWVNFFLFIYCLTTVTEYTSTQYRHGCLTPIHYYPGLWCYDANLRDIVYGCLLFPSSLYPVKRWSSMCLLFFT